MAGSHSSKGNLAIPRFALRSLLLGVALVAIGVFAGKHAYFMYRGNYAAFVSRIQKVEGIHDVHVWGDEEAGTRNVELLKFRINGKPYSYVEILSPNCDIFDEASVIRLRQIADMQLSVTYADSEKFRGTSVDVGSNSVLKPILPFTVRNIDELISRYDDLETYFKRWPKNPSYRICEISPTRTVEYRTYKID